MHALLSGGAAVTALSCTWPPLSHAAAHGQLAAAQLLLDSGAPVDQPTWSNATALVVAAANGHTDVVGLLLSRGAAVDVQTAAGRAALMAAAEQGHAAAVRLLLACKAHTGLVNVQGKTAQQLAPPNSTALALLQRPTAICEGATVRQLAEVATLALRRQRVSTSGS